MGSEDSHFLDAYPDQPLKNYAIPMRWQARVASQGKVTWQVDSWQERLPGCWTRHMWHPNILNYLSSSNILSLIKLCNRIFFLRGGQFLTLFDETDRISSVIKSVLKLNHGSVEQVNIFLGLEICQETGRVVKFVGVKWHTTIERSYSI